MIRNVTLNDVNLIRLFCYRIVLACKRYRLFIFTALAVFQDIHVDGLQHIIVNETIDYLSQQKEPYFLSTNVDLKCIRIINCRQSPRRVLMQTA